MRPYLDDQDGMNTIFLLYRWYRSGHLSDPGQISDQSNRFVVYSLVCDVALDDAERERRKKREKESNAQARKGRAMSKGKRPGGYRGRSSRGGRR